MPNLTLLSLDSNCIITKQLTKEEPAVENHSEDKLRSVLFLPKGEGRKGEGGLRTKGYFKKSHSDKPLVSIVTVVYNGEEYLEQTIESVIGQTYDNVEYIVIDGGSTDGTLDIVRKYEGQIDYWVSEPDGGIYDAMNKGITLSQGKWINFMNAGDLFYQLNSTGLLINTAIETHSDIVFGHTEYIYTENHRKIIFATYFKKKQFGMPFCHQSSLIKVSIHKKYPYNLSYKIGADYDFFFMLNHLEKKYVLVDEVISSFTLGGLSSMMTPLHKKERKEVLSKYNSGIMFNIELCLWEWTKFVKYYIKKLPFVTEIYHKVVHFLKLLYIKL